MTGGRFAIAAYVIGLGLMLGYALLLWINGQGGNRQNRSKGEK